MGFNNKYKKSFFVFGLAATVAVFQGCSEVNFQPSGAAQSLSFGPGCSPVELLITDSFERESVDDRAADSLFGWRKIVNDRGRMVGSSGDRVSARIYSESEMGPAASGDRALYFYGRPGSSVHNIYLISEALPLSDYNQVGIAFKYIPVDLEMAGSGPEYLRVEVCNSSLAKCGVGDDFGSDGLKSSHWVTVFETSLESDGTLGSGLNGRNHSLSDWRSQSLVVDLSDLPKDQFVFRFNVLVDEGFFEFKDGEPILKSGMDDGVILDDVVVAAVNCR